MNNSDYREKQRKETEKIIKEAHEDYEEIMAMGRD